MFNPIIGPLPTFLLSLGGAGPAQPWHHPGGGECENLPHASKSLPPPKENLGP